MARRARGTRRERFARACAALALATTRAARASTPERDASECQCLSIHDPRFVCAPRAHAGALPTETARRVLEQAIKRGDAHGWERTRLRHAYLDETYEVKVSDVPETTRNEVRSAYEKYFIPLAREQCMVDDHFKFEDEAFFVVKYDAKGDFKSTATHVDGKHLSFVASLNNVTEYSGGGNNFEGMSFSVPHGGVHKLDDHVVPAQPIGSVVVHGSQLEHSSFDVTSGQRYVLVVEAHVNKSCCFDFTTFMNKFVTRLLIVIFAVIAVMGGVVDYMQKSIQKARNGGVAHEKVW
jgi:hypothetical protein